MGMRRYTLLDKFKASFENFDQLYIVPWILVYTSILGFLICTLYHSDHSTTFPIWEYILMLGPDKTYLFQIISIKD